MVYALPRARSSKYILQLQYATTETLAFVAPFGMLHLNEFFVHAALPAGTATTLLCIHELVELFL